MAIEDGIDGNEVITGPLSSGSGADSSESANLSSQLTDQQFAIEESRLRGERATRAALLDAENMQGMQFFALLLFFFQFISGKPIDEASIASISEGFGIDNENLTDIVRDFESGRLGAYDAASQAFNSMDHSRADLSQSGLTVASFADGPFSPDELRIANPMGELDTKITSDFGPRDLSFSRMHHGVDFRTRQISARLALRSSAYSKSWIIKIRSSEAVSKGSAPSTHNTV